jgi:ParB family chromosome partitioning protein
MSQKKPTLGRGLADLLGPRGPALSPAPGQDAAPESSTPGEQLVRLPLDVLQRGKYQPRVDMHPESLEDLAGSIKVQGVVQPIVVRPLALSPGEPQRYEIIAGERRWRAAQMAGLDRIPAIVRHVPDEAAIAVALIENIQRENLNPLEEARALQRLIGEFALTHAQAAEAVGRSRAGVSNLLRLLDLAPEVCELIVQRQIEMGHARALLGLAQRHQQAEIARRVVKKGLSVRETEALVRHMQQPRDGNGGAQPPAPRNADVRHLEQELAEKLGAKVAIHHTEGGKGQLVVSYNSLDELDGILAHIN